MQRHDGALPTVVAIAHGAHRPGRRRPAGAGGPRPRARHQFIIQEELRAVIPQREDCTPERVKAAMEFLCDEWLVDVATDYTGKCTIIAAALTLIERSLLPDRPCFFVTAGRRGGGKTTTHHHADHGRHRDMAGSGGVVDQRGGAAQGADELLPRTACRTSCGTTSRAACRSRARTSRSPAPPRTTPTASSACSEMVCTAASTIHFFTGNNIGPRGDLASRSLHIRLDVDRADPENRTFKHPDPVGWTENHRAEILAALYTILLGNPQLKAARDAEGKTRFKMWWRLVGSAVENAAKLAGQELDFQKLFITQEEDDEESASLADVLDVLVKKWPDQFTASDVAGMINNPSPNEDEQTLREYLLPGALPNHVFSAKSIGKLLKQHLDEPVRSGERTLVLRSWEDKHIKLRVYGVRTITTT